MAFTTFNHFTCQSWKWKSLVTIFNDFSFEYMWFCHHMCTGQNIYWWNKSTELSKIFLENDEYGKEDWFNWCEFYCNLLLIKKHLFRSWFIQKAMTNIDLNKLVRIYRYIAK